MRWSLVGGKVPDWPLTVGAQMLAAGPFLTHLSCRLRRGASYKPAVFKRGSTRSTHGLQVEYVTENQDGGGVASVAGKLHATPQACALRRGSGPTAGLPSNRADVCNWCGWATRRHSYAHRRRTAVAQLWGAIGRQPPLSLGGVIDCSSGFGRVRCLVPRSAQFTCRCRLLAWARRRLRSRIGGSDYVSRMPRWSSWCTTVRRCISRCVADWRHRRGRGAPGTNWLRSSSMVSGRCVIERSVIG